MEFNYKRSVFYGSGKAKKSFLFLPADASVNWTNLTVTGGKLMVAGNKLGFRTEFTENEIMTTVSTGKKYDFQIGYYEMRWQRPSDYNTVYSYTDGTSQYPIMYEAIYESSGFVLVAKNKIPSSPGLNCDFRYWGGLKSKITTALGKPQGDKEEAHSDGFRLGLWYNWFWCKHSTTGFYSTLGLLADYRNWSIDKEDGGLTIDGERLFGVFGSLGYRF